MNDELNEAYRERWVTEKVISLNKSNHIKELEAKLQVAVELIEYLRLQVSGYEFNNNMTNRIDTDLLKIKAK